MLRNFFEIIGEGLRMDGAALLFLWIIIAAAFSALCWWICTHYTRLWNKKYEVTTGFHVLCAIAAVVTFCASLCFIGQKNTRPVAQEMVDEWTEDAGDDYELQNASFVKAFYAVRDAGKEDMRGYRTPEKGGDIIPMSYKETRILVSNIYASDACRDFYSDYPFLGWFLKADEGVPTELIAADQNRFFRSHPGQMYPLERGFQLGIEQINTQLQEQTGRIVRVTRLWLVLLFLLVQLIPFGAIGYMAYKDIFNRHTERTEKSCSDDFDLNL